LIFILIKTPFLHIVIFFENNHKGYSLCEKMLVLGDHETRSVHSFGFFRKDMNDYFIIILKGEWGNGE